MEYQKTGAARTENVRFRCQRCAACCYTQLIPLTTGEINRILEFIDGLVNARFRKFVKQTFPVSWKQKVKYGKDLLKAFYFPHRGVVCGDVGLVREYVMFMAPPTGRCLFFNPDGEACLIYEARPHVCRFYPMKLVEWGKKMEVDRSCIGIGKEGGNLDPGEANEELVKWKDEMKRDTDAFLKFAGDNGIRIEDGKAAESNISFDEFVKSRVDNFFGKEKADVGGSVKIRHPFIELGIIPSNLLIEDLMKKREKGRRIM